MKKTYPLYKVHVDVESATSFVKSVLNSGFINEGQEVVQLTNEIAERFGTKQVVLLNSCTSALTLALQLSHVQEDDYVISTPMTCVATNTPIVNMGAHVMWADIDPKRGTISVDSVKDLLEEEPGVKAVVGVDWAGMPIDLSELQNLCDDYGIYLIQDAAQAFGATYKNLPIHASSDFTAYSFQAVKHFSTGDGGALVCLDEEHWLKSKQLKWFGIDRDASKDIKGNWKGQHWDFDIATAGYKFNMNNIAAAVGLSQLDTIDAVVSRHKDNAKLYTKLFDNVVGITPILQGADRSSSYWTYTVMLDEKIDRDAVIKALNDDGIMAGLMHVPNHKYSCFSKYYRHLEGVEEFFRRQISLPCGWWLDSEDVEHIVDRIVSFINENTHS